MTIRVNTGVEGHTYDQSGATFAVGSEGELTISSANGTVAVYADGSWAHVTDEQFDTPIAKPPTAGQVVATPANAAPPHPTSIVVEPDVVPANLAPPAPTPPRAPVAPVVPSNEAPPVPVAAPAPPAPSSNPAP